MLSTTALAADFFSPQVDKGPSPLADDMLLRVARQAMATQFEIILPVEQSDAYAAADDALDLIDRLEDQLSIFRDTSELSLINDSAYAHAVVVERNLFDLLLMSARLTKETAGAFDIATGALSSIWGFLARSGHVPSVAERITAMTAAGRQYSWGVCGAANSTGMRLDTASSSSSSAPLPP